MSLLLSDVVRCAACLLHFCLMIPVTVEPYFVAGQIALERSRVDTGCFVVSLRTVDRSCF
jgi:hypothetical protein